MARGPDGDSEESPAPGPASAERPVAVAATTHPASPAGADSTLPWEIGDAGTSADQLVVGTVLGRYQVRRVVGAGGMGLVLAAHDAELGRSVAIKLLARDHEEARTRLVREAQAMARLSHPNVVTVHEVLRLGDRAGIVMELVDGQDLASWRAAGDRSWREIMAAYVQAARGLAAAHRAGLVHRDFKPSNALIDRDGVVRVTDFGLVRTTDDAATRTPATADDTPGGDTLTRTGAVLGTPAYMAPEQHRGEAVDARTDQWALACSLYGALYRQRPFAGETQRELAAAVLAGTIRPEPGEPAVPRGIRAAIRKGLALRPEDRFASMDELIAALTPARRAWQAATIGAITVAGAIAVFAIVRGGDAGATTCTGLDAPVTAVWNPTRTAALRARFAAAGPSYAGVAADHAITGLDAHASRWIAARTQACTQARQGVGSPELLDRRMRCLDQRLVELDAVIGGLVEADAKTIRRAGDAVDRLHAVADCDDPRDSVPRPAAPAARAEIDRGETTLARATALWDLAQFERALPLALEAAAIGERTQWPPLAARALVLAGRCEGRLDDNATSVATLDRASHAGAQAHDDVVVAEALVARFYVLGDSLGKPSDALAGRQFIELALERAAQPKRLRALWLHNLAIILLSMNKYDDALAAETEAVAILRQVVPPGHVELIDALQTQGNIQIYRKQFAESEALLEEVLAARIANRGEAHPSVASALNNLAVLEANRGDMVAAVEQWERALAIDRAAGGKDWIGIFNLGLAKFELGRWNRATDDLIAAVAAAEAQAPGETVPVATTTMGLGGVYIARGELDRAQPLIERAIAAARASGSGTLADAIAGSAQLALARGDRKAAAALVEQAAAATASTRAQLLAELARAGGGCAPAIEAYDRALAAATAEGTTSIATEATVGRGECELELGRVADAVATLEPRVAWLDKVGADPAASARARFALARALIKTDRDRARALAAAARDGYETLGSPGAARAATVSRWLAGQGGPR